MSHYIALVPANNREDLAAKMLPYHEYGLGMDMGEGEKRFLVHDKEHGLHNPNARWDWYGRECGLLKLKPQWAGQRTLQKLAWWIRHQLLKLEPRENDPCIGHGFGATDNALVGQVNWESITQNNPYGSQVLIDAFVDLEGNWHDRRMMNELDKERRYDAAVWRFVRSLPNRQRIYTVYYHS